MLEKTVVTVNSTGRQSASFVRVASAVGWRVRAQVRSREGLVADELAGLPNVEIVEGSLEEEGIIEYLFKDIQVAFINTTPWGDEVAMGCALADAAKRAGVEHYIYSSMPDHSRYEGRGWKALPLWVQKAKVEQHIRRIGLPATFIYTGIYNNNFTSLPYPLFRMELQDDGSFVWQAPFHPDDPLPWLDAEHDVGPTVLQVSKSGPEAWVGQRITLAFERLTPRQLCARFSRGVSRPVVYRHGPIEISVSTPAGYREHLEVLEETLGRQRAPYFGPDLEYPKEARSIWEGYRGIEEYAREVFPVEESANGMTWMDEREEDSTATTLAETPVDTPGTRTPSGARTPSRHPEGDEYFLGSC
ncbi:hypothetical protein B0A49_01098 [Cryomyces minteri]|uniref:NmrA-like domain-containing protein n=1 Tax=Cryomyces minteri TaxID=331657 RepID=A0A4U0XTT0_9PEZI|nr:hypothetical protein B0A49_01098 [Cryomyces minteri]